MAGTRFDSHTRLRLLYLARPVSLEHEHSSAAHKMSGVRLRFI